MWNGFIGDLIRRTNRRLLITAFLLLACLALFFGYNRGYFYGFFHGPRTVSAQQLTAAASPAAFPNRFVAVQDEREEPTQLEDISHKDGQDYVEAGFMSAVVGGHHMLVRVGPDAVPVSGASAATLTGQLKSVDDLRNHLEGSYSTPQDDLLPVYLDTYEYKTFGYGSLAIGVPLLLLALWMLWRWWQVSSDLSRHPLCRRLAAQGQLELMIQQIDSELAAPHLTVGRRGASAHVTPHWLLIDNFFGGSVMQLSTIAWVYRSLIKRRLYFVITVSKRHLLNVRDMSGHKAAIQLSEAKTQQLYDGLRQATPRAVHGYDKRLLSLWRSTPNKAGFPDAAAAMLSGQTLPDQRVANTYGA